MKLSELLSKPFKVKGGGFLNLKGFSKRVIDEEIGGNDGGGGFNSFLSFEEITDTDKLDELRNITAPIIYGLSIYDNNNAIHTIGHNSIFAFQCEVDNPFKNFTITFNVNVDIGILYKYCGNVSSKDWYVPQAIYDNVNDVFYDIPGDKFDYYGIEMVANPLIPILYKVLAA